MFAHGKELLDEARAMMDRSGMSRNLCVGNLRCIGKTTYVLGQADIYQREHPDDVVILLVRDKHMVDIIQPQMRSIKVTTLDKFKKSDKKRGVRYVVFADEVPNADEIDNGCCVRLEFGVYSHTYED